MALEERTAQAQLTPEERRGHLRAFADRMLLKITAMDDPEDLPGVEKAVRVAAVIERVYSRCDRAERQVRTEAPALFKAEADCANHQIEAIRGRVSLAGTLEWEDKRRRALGAWYDAAEQATQSATRNTPTQVSAPPKTPNMRPNTVVKTPNTIPTAIYSDDTDGIQDARADMAFRERQTAAQAELPPLLNAEKPPPPA